MNTVAGASAGEPRLFATSVDRRTAWLAWGAVLAASFVLLPAGGFSTGDPDSKLYAAISARLVGEPVSRWIAPEWWGAWGFEGPYREHPVGLFVPAAVVGRVGYPAAQAAYAVNGVYQILSIVLLQLIALRLVNPREARTLGWLVQLMPIGFVFRIRANQEHAVLAGLLLALYACERARTRSGWMGGMLAGFVAVLLIKGVFAFMVPLACVLWLVARGPASLTPGGSKAGAPPQESSRSTVRAGTRVPVAAWVGVLLMPVVGLAGAWAYETVYMHVTGSSFLHVYRARQVPEGALISGSPILRTAYNLGWYIARVLWFAFPWAPLGIVGIWKVLRAGAADWRRDSPERSISTRAARQGAWFAAAAAIVLLVAFSLAHRKADRYIFPIYYVMAAVGGVTAIRASRRLVQLAVRVDRPWTPAALWLALFLLRLVTRSHLPQFTFWRS